MAKEKGNALIGMEKILKYYPRSESTIIQLIIQSDFPAKKIHGRWESNTAAIDKWQEKRVSKRDKQKPRGG